MEIFYQQWMYRIKSFLFGKYSTNAHKHLGKIVALGFAKGVKKSERK